MPADELQGAAYLVDQPGEIADVVSRLTAS
jgi:hypothetical protein